MRVPTYREATVKVAQDCDGHIVTGDDRGGGHDEAMRERLSAFVRKHPARSGRPARSRRCLYRRSLRPRLRRGSTSRTSERHNDLGAAHEFKLGLSDKRWIDPGIG
jgi:hypothetical protein